MSSQDWDPDVLFDRPVVRPAAEEPLRVEQPPQAEAQRSPAPPVPGHDALRAVHGDPRLAAELWQGVEAPAADEGPSVAQLGVALYLLQSLHAPGAEKPEQRTPPRGKDDDRDEA